LHPRPEYDQAGVEPTGENKLLKELLYGPQDYAVIGYRP
jgi:hypothetical protein